MKLSKPYIKIAFWLSLSISILVHFSRIIDQIIVFDSTQIAVNLFIANILVELFITFIIPFVLFNLNYFILQPFLHNSKHTIWFTALSFVVSFAFVLIFSHLLFGLKHQFFHEIDNHKKELQFVYKDIFVAMVVIISIHAIRIVHQNQQNKTEIQALRIENLQRQYDSLKNQLSPHFLFNALNALKTLVRESPPMAQQYISNLSAVLRYTLQANEWKLISLAEEMKFVDSYFYLVKLRYNQNIMLDIDIEPQLFSYQLPPLALQILIENAIKHNEISKRHPLNITICTSDKCTLKVMNIINEKFAPENGTGIGLTNLIAQYRLLNAGEIEITKGNNTFIVEIPLIKP